MRVERVLETSLYVDDLDRAARFYHDVLDLSILSIVADRHVFFRCGPGMLLLFNPRESLREGDIPTHGGRGPGHVAFAVSESSVEEWRSHLGEQNVDVEQEVSWEGGGVSLYLRDPAGNSVELATPQIWAD